MNPGHFVIHTREGDIVCHNNTRGMPHLNLQEVEAEVALCLIKDMIDTVCNNFDGYTKQEVIESKEAREGGNPRTRNFWGWYVTT